MEEGFDELMYTPFYFGKDHYQEIVWPWKAVDPHETVIIINPNKEPTDNFIISDDNEN